MRRQHYTASLQGRRLVLPDGLTRCPRCDCVAYSVDRIEKLFGFRRMNDQTVRPQSWCRICRVEKSKEKNP